MRIVIGSTVPYPRRPRVGVATGSFGSPSGAVGEVTAAAGRSFIEGREDSESRAGDATSTSTLCSSLCAMSSHAWVVEQTISRPLNVNRRRGDVNITWHETGRRRASCGRSDQTSCAANSHHSACHHGRSDLLRESENNKCAPAKREFEMFYPTHALAE